MVFEASLDPNSQLLLANGGKSYFQAVRSHNSLTNEEYMNSVLRMEQNSLSSDVLNSSFLGNHSITRSDLGNPNREPYISLPSDPNSFSGNISMNVFQSGNTFSHLFEGARKEIKMQQPENVKGLEELCKKKLPTSRASPPVKIKRDPGSFVPSPKKPRIGVVEQENFHQQKQDNIDKLLLKDSQDRNLQLTWLIEKYGLNNNMLQKPMLHSDSSLGGQNLQLPKQMMINALRNQGNLQRDFVPLLDGGICSRRLKQYLFHLRNKTHDNGIAYWQKFVSEYYAPGSKKRWCFCKYENIQLQATSVFYPKLMEAWSCDICGSTSGKGLEATFDIFPRLFKTKFESGLLDEILFLDSPRACNISCGLVLEYRRAIQESVYEKFHVIHEGRLRIVFRYDLKILSWEFCAQNHEEFILRRFITPEVNQLVQACKIYQNDIQKNASFSSENLQTLCDVFVSTEDKIVKNMETQLVNDLGYPKRLIRCLQIAEMVDSMKDAIALSLETKMGPIECWNSISSQRSRITNQTSSQIQSTSLEKPGPQHLVNIRQMSESCIMSGSGSSGMVHQLFGQNSCDSSTRRKGPVSSITQSSDARTNASPKSQSSAHAKNPHQASVEKLLHEMVSADRRTSQNGGTKNGPCHGENDITATGQSNLGGSSRNASNFSEAAAAQGDPTAVNRNIAVKIEPCSPEPICSKVQH